MAGVYLHIPFCKRICAYCDFYKSARLMLREGVLESMHRELEERASFLRESKIETIYFGGGTPSLCRAEELESFIEQIRTRFDTSTLGEITAEVNPDDLTGDYLEALARGSINRLSMGIQSLNDEELRLMNRRHTAREAREAVMRARESGFENLTVDMIFGVEGFGGDHLRRKVDEILALEAPHISAYHLTIEPDTAFGRRMARGEMRPVNEGVSEVEFAYIHERLTEAGYEHYEVSNYARKGYRARHNTAYWQGKPYLGIGPAAHSFDGERRRWSTDTVDSYTANKEWWFEEEILTQKDHLNEMIMTRLRTSDGLSLEHFRERFGQDNEEQLLEDAAQFLESGLLRLEGERIFIPAEKLLLSDFVIEALFRE